MGAAHLGQGMNEDVEADGPWASKTAVSIPLGTTRIRCAQASSSSAAFTSSATDRATPSFTAMTRAAPPTAKASSLLTALTTMSAAPVEAAAADHTSAAYHT